jgi:predicted P-loop ATPase
LIPFRTEAPFKKIAVVFAARNGGGEERIEFLGDGQQFAAFGTHPETMQPYSWHGGEPGQIKRADLPYIDEAAARALVEDIVELLVREHGYRRKDDATPRRGKRKDAARKDAPESAAARVREIAEELAALPPGARNETLYKRAFYLGTMVNRGWLSRDTVKRDLAAAVANWDEQEKTLNTLDRGLTGGEECRDADPTSLSVDKNNVPYKTQGNVRVALAELGVRFRLDVFADRMLVEGLPGFGPILDDAAVDRLWLWVDQRFRLMVPKALFYTIVTDTARQNAFHPVRDYLDALVWDGKPRVDRWLTDYAGVADTEYVRAVGALFLMAAVRRVRRPGVKFDEMLVFESPDQGTDKSSGLAVLAVREEWFSDDVPLNMDGKRVIEALRGKWIVEAAELSGMRRSDIEHLKAFLSRQVDRARMSYDRLVTEVPRQSVIAGTTNSEEYLRDTTGNRRFWPVRLKRFDLAALSRDRDQLWAEAAAREAAGESIRLDPRLWPAAGEAQAERLTQDPFYEELQAALGDMEGKIASTSVWTILNVQPGHRTQDQNQRVGKAMRDLGWRRANSAGTVKIDGKLVVGYVRGKSPTTIVIMAERRYDKEGGQHELLVYAIDGERKSKSTREGGQGAPAAPAQGKLGLEWPGL